MMNRLRCVAIDDDKGGISVIDTLISKTDNLELTASETNPMAGLKLIKKNAVDVVFLDIEMSPISGLELMQQIDPKIKVILCTSHRNYGAEAYELGAFDYLTKPIGSKRFFECVRRLEESFLLERKSKKLVEEPTFFTVKVESKGKRIRIDYKDIDYIEANEGGCEIYILGSIIPICINRSLAKMEAFLPKSFMQIHKSFIVALDRIDMYENGHVALRNTGRGLISVGETFQKKVLEFMDGIGVK